MSDAGDLTSQDARELYRYGYKLLIMQFINISVAVAIGFAFSCLKEMILFLAAFIPLRSYAGGYHAGGPLTCGVLSAGMELAAAAALQFMVGVQTVNGMLPIIAVCAIVIYMLAPVAAEHKPLSDFQITSFRKKARMILAVEMAVMAVFYAIGAWSLFSAVAMCHILTAGLLVAGKITVIVKKEEKV